MDNINKIYKERLIKAKPSNKKVFIHKNLSFNKATNKTKNSTNPINLNTLYFREKLIYNNLKKYNITPKKFNTFIINDIVFDHRTHIVAIFKNYLLWNETSEFLKRYYPKRDIFGRLPKITEYYEHYTLFTPNYLSNDGLLLIIMLKTTRRKKKYLQYLEEKEENKKNIKSKNLNKNFEPLFKEEIISTTKTKSKSFISSSIDVSKNTLELTTFANESYFNQRFNTKRENKGIEMEKDNEFKNSVSFTEIFDDLSSHFSVLINKEYNIQKLPIKNFTNKACLAKKEIITKNNTKKFTKQINQKCLNKKPLINKQINNVKKDKDKEKETIPVKIKEIHKVNKTTKKNNSKKVSSSKDKNKNDKIIENSKEKNKLANNNNNNKDIKKFKKVSIININLKDNKDINNNQNKNNQLSKNKMKNISILNSNSGRENIKAKAGDENTNIINTISNINPQYYSIGKLVKNNKQSSAIKKMNMKSLNLLNFNHNVIPNLKKIVNNQKEKKIIFPRNFNLMYDNNTNKINSIKRENYEQIKLLTDRDKENNKVIINTNENSKFIKLNDNSLINNKQNNNENLYFDQNDLFSKKIGKLSKKKHISLFRDNISFKEPNHSNILLYKNDNNKNVNINNISNLNNLRYKKNSVLRQFNSKRDFNFSNSKNNILHNYNNMSNNSISSSSSSLNSLNKKKSKLSTYLSQNSSINKNRKFLQKINLNLNLQINFNINLDKKNKKILLGKRLNNRIFNEITNNKNINNFQNNQGNDSNKNSNNISVPLSQRCYYNINQYQKYLGDHRSSSSSNSKKKNKGKILI